MFNLDSNSAEPFCSEVSAAMREWLWSIARDFPNGLLLTGRFDSARTAEIHVLQKAGFYFTELTLHPTLLGLQQRKLMQGPFSVEFAEAGEVISLVASSTPLFAHSRFHSDQNVESLRADRRFDNWILGALDDPNQEVLLIRREIGGETIAIFVQSRIDMSTNWGLTALLPHHRGQGFGTGVWQSVLCFNQSQGINEVTTQISAQNLRTIPLYVRSGFQFVRSSVALHFFSAA